jgi:biotin carboxyl carrier protein
MQKTFRITVDGRSYNVVVEDITAPPPLGGSPLASLVTTAPVAPAQPAPVPAAPPVPAGPGSEVAPLAGVVYAIDVHVGQAVQPGDRIATIEAMKMKTFVLAKGAGTVTAIAVNLNDSVEAGQVLLTLG